MEKKHLSAAETAALIRPALKQAFPGVKFSVKSQRHGSINVGWQDGPNSAQVEAVVKRYEGKYFDGMIDYAGYKYASLDGAPVHFGADYVFCNRSYSDAMVQRAIVAVVAQWGPQPALNVADWRAGRLYATMAYEGAWNRHDSLQDLVWRDLAKRSVMLAQPSPEAERVQFLGDDGYGRGTVGLPGGAGGEQCYKGEQENRERIAKEGVPPIGRVIGEVVIDAAFKRLEAPGRDIILIQPCNTVQ